MFDGSKAVGTGGFWLGVTGATGFASPASARKFAADMVRNECPCAPPPRKESIAVVFAVASFTSVVICACVGGSDSVPTGDSTGFGNILMIASGFIDALIFGACRWVAAPRNRQFAYDHLVLLIG